MSPRKTLPKPKLERFKVQNMKDPNASTAQYRVADIDYVIIRLEDREMVWDRASRSSLKQLHAALGRYLEAVGIDAFEEQWLSE